MKVTITRDVPGYCEARHLRAGDVVDVQAVTAVSLIQDGYAEAVRAAPVESAETADVKPRRAAKRPAKEA